MASSEYLRQQAGVCLRLAATTEDEQAAVALVAIAEDFSVRADEVDPSLRPSGRAAIEDSSAGSVVRHPAR
jgi:hypothetical protein